MSRYWKILVITAVLGLIILEGHDCQVALDGWDDSADVSTPVATHIFGGNCPEGTAYDRRRRTCTAITDGNTMILCKMFIIVCKTNLLVFAFPLK